MSAVKKTLYILCWCCLIASCRPEMTNNQSEVMPGLASPVVLEPGDTASFMISDYVMDPASLDSVVPPPGYNCMWSVQSGMVSLYKRNKNPDSPVEKMPSSLRLWVKGQYFDIPVVTRYKKEVILRPDASFPKESLMITGDFNNWKPAPVTWTMENGEPVIRLYLSPGRYGYQLVSRGIWSTDPANPLKISNGQGGFNSLLEVDRLSDSEIPFIETVSFTRKSVTVRLRCGISAIVSGFYQNQLMDLKKIISEDNNTSLLTFNIPKDAGTRARSHLRFFCKSEFTSGNDLLIPLQNGLVITQSELLSRSDYQSNIMYFLMVDRFSNGNPLNDYTMDTQLVKDKARFMGGDLRGLLNKLKEGYFESLGINCLWISPITRNPKGAWGQFSDPDTRFSAYHGYWPTALTRLDERFGTEEELKQLLDEAHKRNINVLLDYVAHHLHIEHPLIKKHPDWVTPLYLPDGTMNTEKWDEHRLTTWFDTFLPTLNLSDQKIANYMVDSALHWVKNFEFDGFRHDATKHIPLNFWRTLTYRIKTEVEPLQKRNIYQIGETYGNNELISSYVQSGMLNAQFNFNLYDALLPVFTTKESSFKQLSDALRQSFAYYGYQHTMGNLVGNQDKPRFISYADGQITSAIPWQETKRIGWKKNIQVQDTLAYHKLLMAQAFNLTIPGIPIIYYGDEWGMPGANDPDNRRFMRFSGHNLQENRLLSQIKALVEIRRTEMALMYGDFSEIEVTDQIYAYRRKYFNTTIVVVLNKSEQSQTFKMRKHSPDHPRVLFGSPTPQLSGRAFFISTLAPFSVTVLKWKD